VSSKAHRYALNNVYCVSQPRAIEETHATREVDIGTVLDSLKLGKEDSPTERSEQDAHKGFKRQNEAKDPTLILLVPGKRQAYMMSGRC
jgi:hypothetical protein